MNIFIYLLRTHKNAMQLVTEQGYAAFSGWGRWQRPEDGLWEVLRVVVVLAWKAK